MKAGARRYAVLWALAPLWIAAAQPLHADERILSYDSSITVNTDGSLYVRETIRVIAEGRKIRRGIYRDFPTTYPREGGGQVSVEFAFQAASRDGMSEPWHTEARGNGVRVYVGSPSSSVSQGEHTYELVYRTDRQLGYFADHDELYWNVTGTGWDLPIDSASARVLLPDAIPRAEIRMEGYTGSQGVAGKDYEAALDGNAPFFRTTRGLGPREGLTLVAMWPRGFIMPPVEAAGSQNFRPAAPGYGVAENDGKEYFDSPAEAFLHRQLPRDNRPVFFGLAGLALLIGYYYFIWNRVGRDPPGRVVIPEYEMPPNLSPAAMRYLVRMS